MKISAVIASVEAILKPYLPNVTQIRFSEYLNLEDRKTEHSIAVYFDKNKLPEGANTPYGNLYVLFYDGFNMSMLTRLIYKALNEIGIETESITEENKEFTITLRYQKKHAKLSRKIQLL